MSVESQGPAHELDALIVDTLARNRARLSTGQADFILRHLPKPHPPVAPRRRSGVNNRAIEIAARSLYFLSRGEPLPIEWLFADLPPYKHYAATYIDHWGLEATGVAVLRGVSAIAFDWSLPLNDVERAKKHGISRNAVRKARVAAGVASPIKRNAWTPEIDSLIGSVPDAEVARRFGLVPKSVGERRRKLGKAPFKRPHGKVATMLLAGYSVQEIDSAIDWVGPSRILECQRRLIRDGALEAMPMSPSHSKATG